MTANKKMPDMINSDKLLQFKSLFEQIILLAKEVESKNNQQLYEKIFQLLDMLVHMQSLNISIRTELIEKLISIRPDLFDKIKSQQKNGADIIVLYDRRKVKRSAYWNSEQTQEC
jgi:hypothetical protein